MSPTVSSSPSCSSTHCRSCRSAARTPPHSTAYTPAHSMGMGEGGAEILVFLGKSGGRTPPSRQAGPPSPPWEMPLPPERTMTVCLAVGVPETQNGAGQMKMNRMSRSFLKDNNQPVFYNPQFHGI
jgi:hypothetical protein